jgi:hypothetical protein
MTVEKVGDFVHIISSLQRGRGKGEGELSGEEWILTGVYPERSVRVRMT